MDEFMNFLMDGGLFPVGIGLGLVLVGVIVTLKAVV